MGDHKVAEDDKEWQATLEFREAVKTAFGRGLSQDYLVALVDELSDMEVGG